MSGKASMTKERPNEAVKTCEHNRTLPLAVLVRFSALPGVLAVIQDGLKTKKQRSKTLYCIECEWMPSFSSDVLFTACSWKAERVKCRKETPQQMHPTARNSDSKTNSLQHLIMQLLSKEFLFSSYSPKWLCVVFSGLRKIRERHFPPNLRMLTVSRWCMLPRYELATGSSIQVREMLPKVAFATDHPIALWKYKYGTLHHMS